MFVSRGRGWTTTWRRRRAAIDRFYDWAVQQHGLLARKPAEALAQSETPFKTIQWIKQSPTARMLARLVAGDQPMSHSLLDELPPDRKLHYIRQIMVQTGVLPERHEDLERLPSWLDHHLAGKPAGHASLIRPFLHWFLLRRARSRAIARRYPASAGRDLRRRILVALDLLTWLDEQN